MNARFARVLAPVFLMLLVCSRASCVAARADTSSEIPAASQEDAPAPENAQLSLDVESAPISQVFSLIEAMTLLRARYAAPPDAILSAHFDAEPLLPSLKKMLQDSDWTAQFSGDSLFLNAPKNALWKIWTGKVAPHPSWNRAPEEREYSQTQVRLTSAPDAPSQLTAAISTAAPRAASPQIAAFSDQDVFWKTAPLSFEARRVPGVSVAEGETAFVDGKVGEGRAIDAVKSGAANANRAARFSDEELHEKSFDIAPITGVETRIAKESVVEESAAENENRDSANRENKIGESQSGGEKSDEEKNESTEAREQTASTRAVWMRCDFQLRVVPARLYLTISTPAAATLFLNGAPISARRSGQSRVEISQFVRRGANRVALQWKNAPPFSSSEPLLRYEWQSDLAP